jgi:KUP system potassium uptake protein
MAESAALAAPRTESSEKKLAPLALAALGVVFGDIGTSPLYAFSQCFSPRNPATQLNVLGILSLIIWALIVVVCIKYITFLMRADYDGEGGILALLAQVAWKPKTEGMPIVLGAVALVALFGAAALYGDGVITPAISVISAMEGLEVWTDAAQPLVVPGAIALVVGLFVLQSRGTARIGSLFGPVMLLWFAAIALAGTAAIVQHPVVLDAFNPLYAAHYLAHNGPSSLLIFGAIVLCVTGAEALYADLAHFGRAPIAQAWYLAAFPALLLNYLGQGAHTLAAPGAVSHSFYALFPGPLLIPMVILSTAATIVASQALITGVFSLTHQATELGLWPRLREIHTSQMKIGQIYLPTVNVLLAIGCITIVATFRSSAALALAYGLAVSLTMLATTIAYATLTGTHYRWPLWYRIPVIALFLSWDVPFVLGNLSKIPDGAWLPLLVAGALFVPAVTWDRGRSRLIAFIRSNSMPAEELAIADHEPARKGGIAVFLTAETRDVPGALRNAWIREHLASDTVILLTFVNLSKPYISKAERTQIDQLSPEMLRVRAYYGFMENPKLSDAIASLKETRPDLHEDDFFYYLIAPAITADTSSRRLPAWQRVLYAFMSHNANSLTDSLGIPMDRVMKFGLSVPV